MSITINIHAHCNDHEAVLELLERIDQTCVEYSYQVDQHADEPSGPIGPDPIDYTDDQTPPFGMERPEQANIYAREQYISTLVLWTRENIPEGPLAEVGNQQMRDAYRDILRFGYDAVIQGVDEVQASCLRGAFRDATAGQVPV
jgi:hypothetical protein